MEHAIRSNEVNSLEGLINFINCNQFDCNDLAYLERVHLRKLHENLRESECMTRVNNKNFKKFRWSPYRGHYIRL